MMANAENGKGLKQPFHRLVNTQTTSSLARRLATKLPLRTPDALDLALKSCYDHHAIWGADRTYIVRQEKSCVKEHGIKWKEKIVEDKRNSEMGYKESRGSYRDASNHVQLGIQPHHTSNSRRGYGRSQDGCFYSA